MARITKKSLLKGLSGAIGQVVVKQYSYGTVISKFPNMHNVKPSEKQKEQKARFAKAVHYAKRLLQDVDRKAALQKTLRPGQRIFNAAMKEYYALRKAMGREP